jgi:hypothetical protein
VAGATSSSASVVGDRRRKVGQGRKVTLPENRGQHLDVYPTAEMCRVQFLVFSCLSNICTLIFFRVSCHTQKYFQKNVRALDNIWISLLSRRQLTGLLKF